MICELAELELLLGLGTTVTEEERSVLSWMHPSAEAAVKRHLGYDPAQRRATEYYPRSNPVAGRDISGIWDVNTAHSRARWERSSDAYQTLQVLRLPVRVVHALYVDDGARFGSASGSFASGDLQTQGDDFWLDLSEDRFCPSGLIYSAGSWPVTPGAVKVDYTGGYSIIELSGHADTSSASDTNGQVTTAGVDASGIKRAVLITVGKAMGTWNALKKKTGAGWAGPLSSERLQDYSYTLSSNAQSIITGLVSSLPSEAAEELEPFVNMGVMRL